MTETTLWIIESLVIGAVAGACVVLFMWVWDRKDTDRSHQESLRNAYQEGYQAGGYMRFRERCRIERRCRELEEQIQEIQDDSTTQM